MLFINTFNKYFLERELKLLVQVEDLDLIYFIMLNHRGPRNAVNYYFPRILTFICFS